MSGLIFEIVDVEGHPRAQLTAGRLTLRPLSRSDARLFADEMENVMNGGKARRVEMGADEVALLRNSD
jgi:hypothetical protein